MVDLNLATGGWLFLVLFYGAGLYFGYWTVTAIWQFFTRYPALRVYEDRIVVHPSFWRTPAQIAFGNCLSVDFGRVDRIRPDASTSSGRLSQKCHTLLVIVYLEKHRSKELKIQGSWIEGGAWAVGRTAVQIKRRLRQARGSGRP